MVRYVVQAYFEVKIKEWLILAGSITLGCTKTETELPRAVQSSGA